MDKIVRLTLGWIGATAECVVIAMQYVLGLIWVLYLTITKRKYRNAAFETLNSGCIERFKWILDEYKYFLKR